MSETQTRSTTVETPTNIELEYGDKVFVTYDKSQSSGGYTFTGEVVDTREVTENVAEVDVRDPNRQRSYTLCFTEYGISVRTNYPRDEDNQTLGGDATVDHVDE